MTGRDRLAQVGHSSAPGGGIWKAVQYWFSIVIVPASTVNSISWWSRTWSSVAATSRVADTARVTCHLIDPGDDRALPRRQRAQIAQVADRRQLVIGHAGIERHRAVRGQAVRAPVQLGHAHDHELLGGQVDRALIHDLSQERHQRFHHLSRVRE